MMTHVEYDLLREQMPELKLPSWIEVVAERASYGQSIKHPGEIELKLPCTRDELIAHRCAMLLTTESGDMPKGTL